MEEIISETLQPILELMHMSFTKIDVEALDEEGHYRINVETDEPQLLIGYHGHNLIALQHLLKILLSKKAENSFSITLDVDNYRKRQEESVIQMADQKIDQVRKEGASKKLPPMSPFFRRLVHLHVAKDEFEDLNTYSEGTGNNRSVVITIS